MTSKFRCQSASVGSLWSCQPWFLTANVTSGNLFQLRTIAYWMRMWMSAKDSTQLSKNVKTGWWFQTFFFTPIIEKIPILANIFQMGRNHHPEKVFNYILDCFVLLEEGFYFDSFVRYTPEVWQFAREKLPGPKRNDRFCQSSFFRGYVGFREGIISCQWRRGTSNDR